MKLETFKELAEKHNIHTDKIYDTSYHSQYEILFDHWRNSEINILEIGVWRGDSLKLWAKAFPNAHIYGIDTFERNSFEDVTQRLRGYETHSIQMAGVDSCFDDGYAVKSRDDFFNDIGDTKFHIIIDDGLHTKQAQVNTFHNFIHLLKDDGIYIVEDILDDGGHLEYVKHNIANLNILNMNHMRSADNHQDNILGLWYNDDVLSKQEEICQKNIQKN